MSLACPKCRANLDSTPAQDGKLRCPECGTLFAVKSSDERLQAAPRANRPGVQPPKSSALPIVLIVLGLGVTLVVVFAGLVGVAFYLFFGQSTPTTPGANVTQGNNLDTLTKRRSVLQPNPIGVGKPAPEIEAEDIDGQKFKLSDYRGKVVLLDFWGHW